MPTGGGAHYPEGWGEAGWSHERTIVGYEVIVIQEEPVFRELTADVGPDTTSIKVPKQFMESGGVYKEGCTNTRCLPSRRAETRRSPKPSWRN